jgi:hypothetical protein
MAEAQFWQIIADVCRSDPSASEEWDAALTEALVQLPPADIIEWDRLFDRFAVKAYRTDLWAAAYLINGGASDDGFYYFRCWLIGMGEPIYKAALANPDSLADVATPRWDAEGIIAEAEIYGAAHCAWMQVTGHDSSADYPLRIESAELIGPEWDFDDQSLMRQHLPRLTTLFDV